MRRRSGCSAFVGDCELFPATRRSKDVVVGIVIVVNVCRKLCNDVQFLAVVKCEISANVSSCVERVIMIVGVD